MGSEVVSDRRTQKGPFTALSFDFIQTRVAERCILLHWTHQVKVNLGGGARYDDEGNVIPGRMIDMVVEGSGDVFMVRLLSTCRTHLAPHLFFCHSMSRTAVFTRSAHTWPRQRPSDRHGSSH